MCEKMIVGSILSLMVVAILLLTIFNVVMSFMQYSFSEKGIFREVWLFPSTAVRLIWALFDLWI